jgi:hypothetical protein
LFPLSITAKAPATPFDYHRSIAVPGVSHVVTAVPFQLAISGFSFVWACLGGSTRNRHHIFLTWLWYTGMNLAHCKAILCFAIPHVFH